MTIYLVNAQDGAFSLVESFPFLVKNRIQTYFGCFHANNIQPINNGHE